MRQFKVPQYYRSSIISRVKEIRKKADPRKKDFSPSVLDFGPVKIWLARHFGFCFGVENAIEKVYETLENNKDKNVYMISEMIHNPMVNDDLRRKGLRFIQDTKGNEIIDWNTIQSGDIVMIPAFGTTVELEQKLIDLGAFLKAYDATCPFVVKVWKSAEKLGKMDYSVIVHGKPDHEETKATYSHSAQYAPTLIVKDMAETELLVEIINGTRNKEEFYEIFNNRFTAGFDVDKNLKNVGVVNQTTMLASETKAIAGKIKDAIEQQEAQNQFANTRDTLCYATNDNQTATHEVIQLEQDLAIVIGGYNSSNTTHLVALCMEKMPTFFINGKDKILNRNQVEHFDIFERKELISETFLPLKQPVQILLTSGASCPDSLMDEVLIHLLDYFPETKNIEDVFRQMEEDFNPAN